jgi:hypothetical protein
LKFNKSQLYSDQDLHPQDCHRLPINLSVCSEISTEFKIFMMSNETFNLSNESF